jgi:hypothetical protein
MVPSAAGVAFEGNRTGLRIRVRHFQDVVIPPSLRLELARSQKAVMNISIPLNVRRFRRDFLDNRRPVTPRRLSRTRAYSELVVRAPRGALGEDLRCR